MMGQNVLGPLPILYLHLNETMEDTNEDEDLRDEVEECRRSRLTTILQIFLVTINDTKFVFFNLARDPRKTYPMGAKF